VEASAAEPLLARPADVQRRLLQAYGAYAVLKAVPSHSRQVLRELLADAEALPVALNATNVAWLYAMARRYSYQLGQVVVQVHGLAAAA
jgi:hypothetical protein